MTLPKQHGDGSGAWVGRLGRSDTSKRTERPQADREQGTEDMTEEGGEQQEEGRAHGQRPAHGDRERVRGSEAGSGWGQADHRGHRSARKATDGNRERRTGRAGRPWGASAVMLGEVGEQVARKGLGEVREQASADALTRGHGNG